MHLQFCKTAVTQIMPVAAIAAILGRGCGGLTLAGGQVPTKAAVLIPSSAGQERKNITKSS